MTAPLTLDRFLNVFFPGIPREVKVGFNNIWVEPENSRKLLLYTQHELEKKVKK